MWKVVGKLSIFAAAFYKFIPSNKNARDKGDSYPSQDENFSFSHNPNNIILVCN